MKIQMLSKRRQAEHFQAIKEELTKFAIAKDDKDEHAAGWTEQLTLS